MAKTKLEIALDEYFEHFNQNYPLMITDDSETSEIIKEIKTCIKNNRLAKEPVYEEGCLY